MSFDEKATIFSGLDFTIDADTINMRMMVRHLKLLENSCPHFLKVPLSKLDLRRGLCRELLASPWDEVTLIM